jgi:Pyruvate/2-oxoacid:ferredoxin oxidoreductase gamma subunit
MVMLGSLAKKSELVNIEMLKNAVKVNMRESMRDLNLKAIQFGYDLI